jgi:hypothetical protein
LDYVVILLLKIEKVKWVKAGNRYYVQDLTAIKDAENVYHPSAVVGSIECLHGS